MIWEGSGELWKMITGEESNRNNRLGIKCELL